TTFILLKSTVLWYMSWWTVAFGNLACQCALSVRVLSMNKLIAFHGNPQIKEKYLARIRAHVAADELIHGVYWQNGKGCAVGCTIHSGYHAAYETELGIPRILARLEDGIFENLPNGQAKEWPQKFLAAIPISADLSLVWLQFAVWLLI